MHVLAASSDQLEHSCGFQADIAPSSSACRFLPVRAPQETTVRRALSSDLDAVAAVWHASALTIDGAAPEVPPREALRHRIDAELRSGWDLHIAIRDERVVGMLALRHRDATLDQIFVAPGEQGSGVGKALLEVAKRLMPTGFTLRMAASNERARRFYEEQGLRPLGKGVHPSTGNPVHFYGWKVR